MKVFHRFAPATEATLIDVDIAKQKSTRDGPATTRVSVADPVSRNVATFHCQDAFVPPSFAQRPNTLSCAGQQEELYFRTVRPLLEEFDADDNSPPKRAKGKEAPHRGVVLTYGQTGSGKTYTLFGPPSEIYANHNASKCFTYSMESIQYFQNYLHHQRDSLGVVSRYVLDMFGFMQAKLSFTQESQVPLRIGFDVCAFEIYNETTKDLVAASMSGTSTVGERKPPLPRRASRTGSLCSSRNSNASNDMWAKKEESTVRLTTFVSKSFDYYHKTAEVEGRARDTPAVVQLKNTERRQLLRKMRRIRTTTLVETIAALQELLFARQCSATEHNAFSSRSHLCINFECFTFSTKENESTRVASPRDELNNGFCYSDEDDITECLNDARTALFHYEHKIHDILFVDLAGSESYKENRKQEGAGRADVSNDSFNNSFCVYSASSPNVSTTGKYPTRGRRTSSPFLSSSAEEDRMKKEKERRSMELKNINTSLLSLKKVIHELHKLSTKKSGRNAPLGHVPFKDSTLTTLLEPYMLPDSNGQSHILMLLCCSTKQRDFFETVSTLRLGQEAADIQPSACLASLPYLQSQRLRAEEQELLQLLKENKQKRGLSGRRSSSVDIRKTQPSTAADGAERKFARTASAPLPPRRPSDIEISRKEQDQIQVLTQQAQQYKTAAEDLYKQCNTLCNGYDTCVKELKAAKRSLKEKDKRIAELEQMILSLTKKEEDDEKVHQDPPVVSTVISNAYRGVALARSPSPWTPGMEVVLSPRSSMSRSCSLAAAENRFCGQTAALPAKETEQENQPTMNGNSPPPKQPIRVWDTTGPAKTDRKEKMEESSATLTEDAVLLQDRLSKPLFRPPNSEHNSTNVSVLSDSTNLPYGEKRGNKLANVTNQSHGPKEQVPSAPPSRIYRM